MIRTATVHKDQEGRRLDEAVSLLFEGLSKSEARRIIDRGGCSVNSTMVRVASRSIRAGDVIEVGVMEPGRFRDLLLPPEALLYEDADLIAVNKPSGINSQRTPYQLKGTLEFWVAEHFRKIGINEPARVIHRLDRGTSGVMLFPTHRGSAALLSRRFHDGEVAKCYLAIVCGRPSEERWRVDAPIGKCGPALYGVLPNGKPAMTEFRLVAASACHALLEARPLTGRTHQIRVHLAACGLPVLGDVTYGGEPAQRMMLHCASLAFCNARGEEIRVQAPVDELFEVQAAQFST
jgi:RluA family pseudouridine synthase